MNSPFCDLDYSFAVIPSPPTSQSAALAKAVIDRLRNEVADTAVFVGTNPFDELEFFWEEIDSRAHQAPTAGLRPPFACNTGLLVTPHIGNVGRSFRSSGFFESGVTREPVGAPFVAMDG